MPTIERVRELCARIVAAESRSELERLFLELENAIAAYRAGQNGNHQKSGLSKSGSSKGTARGAAVPTTRRILLVDDEPTILLTMKAILETNGYQVVTAASAAYARLRLGVERYDLVITDLKMEHARAGFDVVRFAAEQSYRPPVVILTACPDLGSDWKEQGAECLWIKPANTPEFLEFLKALLSRQQITT